jgi:multidrug efflux pump subunit AcrA (membrane-fusion protein)
MAKARKGEKKPRHASFPEEKDALPVGLPAWAPRALAWLLALVFAAAMLASLLVPFDRTVDGPFVLLPAAAPAPILMPAYGAVEEILADEGQEVSAGEVLFTVRASPGDPAGSGGILYVRSPVDGILLRRAKFEAGDPVGAGLVLAQVVAVGSPLRAVVDLPEDVLGAVQPGQTARLLLAAYPHYRFGAMNAIVRRVNPIPAQSGERYVVKVFAEPLGTTFSVRGEDRPLLAGLRGEARIVVDRKPLLSNLSVRAKSE